jgi:hypothetical protein
LGTGICAQAGKAKVKAAKRAIKRFIIFLEVSKDYCAVLPAVDC